MKSKSKIFTAILTSIALLGTVGLTSYVSGGENNGGNQTQITLFSEKQTIYSCIVGSITAFNNPSSVGLVTIYDKAFVGRYIRVSGTNSFGGTVISTYNDYGASLHVVKDVDLSGYIVDYNINVSVNYNINVSVINAKLDSYKISQGW